MYHLHILFSLPSMVQMRSKSRKELKTTSKKQGEPTLILGTSLVSCSNFLTASGQLAAEEIAPPPQSISSSKLHRANLVVSQPGSYFSFSPSLILSFLFFSSYICFPFQNFYKPSLSFKGENRHQKGKRSKTFLVMLTQSHTGERNGNKNYHLCSFPMGVYKIKKGIFFICFLAFNSIKDP